MAYTNSVGIMPGAATEKLPFVHSDFKPRSKFAKCFGNFKKSHRNDNGYSSVYEGQKLPLIHYSVTEQRNLVSVNATNRSGRTEYPGFAGKKKLLKKKDNSANSVHPAISGSFTRNQSNAMKKYMSLPNLNFLHQQSDYGTFYHHNLPHDRKHRHRHKNTGEMEFMNYLHQLQQQQHQQNNNYNSNISQNNMDSLFIVDDDDDDDEDAIPHNSTMVIGNVIKFTDPPSSTHKHESVKNSSPHSNKSYNNNYSISAEQEFLNPFAQEIDKRLQEARGKSGMKRNRRRDSDQMRILGDVVTAERMQELLLPRKNEGKLNFDESV